MWLWTSNKGWHSHWFYVKNDAAAPLLEFTERLIEEVPELWRRWGVLEKDKKKIQDHLAAVRILKERGVKGSEIIDTYHTRRVAPLMVPGVSLDGTTLAEGVLSPSEVAQRIKEAMDPSKDNTDIVLDFVYPMPGHPPMRPEPRFIDFISSFSPCLLFT